MAYHFGLTLANWIWMSPAHTLCLGIVDAYCPFLANQDIPLIALEINGRPNRVGSLLRGDASILQGIRGAAIICGRGEVHTLHQYCDQQQAGSEEPHL